MKGAGKKKKEMICLKCNRPLELRKVYFDYLGFQFHADLPACPRCGQVYISEEMVRGKMAEVECSLEDK